MLVSLLQPSRNLLPVSAGLTAITDGNNALTRRGGVAPFDVPCDVPSSGMFITFTESCLLRVKQS